VKIERIMNSKSLLSNLCVAVMCLAGSAMAAEQAPHLSFKVTLNPMGSFIAQSKEMVGDAVATASGFEASEVSLTLDSLKTGIELRDKHMNQNYFESKKFPKAIVKSAKGKGGAFKAQLTVHGKSQPIEGKYELRGGPTGPNWIEVRFGTTLSAFGIEEPSYMGVGVEDEVEVTALVPLRKGAPKK